MLRRYLLPLLVIMAVAVGAFFFYRPSAPSSAQKPAEKGQTVPGPARSYVIDASLQPKTRLLSGSCKVGLINEQSHDLNELFFHLYPNAFRSADRTPAPAEAYPMGFGPGGMDVLEVKVNSEVVPGQVTDTLLRVPLKNRLKPGGQVVVEVRFQVNIPLAEYRFGQFDGVTMLSSWYPVLAVADESGWKNDQYYRLGDPFYSQVADYQVNLVLPTEQVVASTGKQVREEILKDGLKLLVIKAERVRDFALVASSDFYLETLKDGELTLKGYSRKGHEGNGRTALHAASQALRFYGEAFSYAYPYGQFSLVEVPMDGLSGMEYPMLAMINTREYGKSDLRQWWPLISHEVAHQWWYGLVGTDQCKEPWIDEGLAVWSSELFLRAQYRGAGVPRSTVSPPGRILRPLSEFTDHSEYYTLAYYGGSMFWESLEGRIGNEGLLKVWKALAAKYQYREVSTAEILDLIEREAGGEAAASSREFLGLRPEKPAPAESGDQNPVNNIVSGDLPDLVVKSAEVNRRGERNYLIIQVQNQGSQPAGPFTVVLEEPDGDGWKQSLAGLPPGRSYTFNCPSSGRGTVVVDSGNQVQEQDEDNNRRQYGN
ncbi:MAG: hypothetical protein HPY50_08410 [Firmicutes bacterium]|nr:hypothetical protein [Bacillota bacterium]